MRNSLFAPFTSFTTVGGIFVGVIGVVFIGLVDALTGAALVDTLVAVPAGFELGVVGAVVHPGS